MKTGLLNQTDETGFTLLEVIVVAAIMGIIASIAIPGFMAWLPNYRLRSAAQDLLGNFQLAKITAIKTNTNCTIIFRTPVRPIILGSTSTNFDYVVFVDSNKNLEYDAGETVITQKQWADYKDVAFDTSASGTGGTGLSFAFNDNNLPAISFRPNGLPINNSGGMGAGTAFLINTKGKTRSVIVSFAGSIRTIP